MVVALVLAGVLGALGGLAVPALARLPAFGRVTTLLAGYQFQTKAEDAIDAGARFVVPRVAHCTTADTGIVPSAGFGVPSTDSIAGLFVGCMGGQASYFPVLEINGSVHEFQSLSAKPGDTIVVKAAGSPNATVVSLKDMTRKFVHKTLTGAGTGGPGGLSYPWVGDFQWPLYPSTPGEVPAFGKIRFTGSRIDDLSLGSYGGYVGGFDLYDPSETTLEIKTGNLSSNGQSFKTTFANP